MKDYNDYHNYEKRFIGDSDIASLILVGMNETGDLKTTTLNFGEDGSYSAYIIPKDVDVPGYYEKVEFFSDWMKIYDDDGLTGYFYAEEIEVFRSGEYGCIIRLSKGIDYQFKDSDFQLIEK